MGKNKKNQKVLDGNKIIIIFAKNKAFEVRYLNEARPVTGYETLGSGSLFSNLIYQAGVQLKGINRIFFKKEKYEDSEDNLIKQ